MTPNSVLVTCGGSVSGLAVVQGLRYHPLVRIVVADCFDVNICQHLVDHSITVPAVKHEDEYVEALREICRQYQVKLIIPATAHDLLLLAQHASLLEANGTSVAVCPEDLVRVFLDKKQSHQWLVTRNLPVAPSYSSGAEARMYPIIGKPRHGHGSKGQVILQDAEQCAVSYPDGLSDEYLWQPLIKFIDEISLDFAIDFQGVVSPTIARSRCRTFMGFSVVSDDVFDEDVLDLSQRITDQIRQSGGQGIFNVQLLRDTDRLYVSDINPRVGTSSVFTLKHGINLPAFLCQSVQGGRAECDAMGRSPRRSHRMVRYVNEMWLKKRSDQVVQGVVFDLDDTLLDHPKWIAAKLVMLADALSAELPDRDEFLSTALWMLDEGNPRHLFDATADKLNLPDELTQRLIEGYRQMFPELNPLYPDVYGALTALRDMGLKIGILTDNPLHTQRQKLDCCGPLNSLVDEVVFTAEFGAEKPDQRGFVAVANRLAIQPSSLAMVGDNPYRDVLGAHRAGYGEAFWIVRERGLFKFDEQTFRLATSGSPCEFTLVRDLRQLIACLK